MKVNELIEQTGWKNISTAKACEKEISGVYVGDLLSWVMGKGQPQQAWVTVQAHMNVIAVAVLIEFSCIIIADSIDVPEDVVSKAKEENLAVLVADCSSFECSRKMIELGM